MEIVGKLHVYRVDQTKKREWVQCRSLVTFAGQDPVQCTVLRPIAQALTVGEHIATFAVKEREGNLSLEVVKVGPVEVRKAA